MSSTPVSHDADEPRGTEVRPALGHVVIDNPDASRFELRDGDTVVGVVDYDVQGDVMVIPHVEVAPALRGGGHSAPFLDEVLALVEHRGLHVRPLCSYAAAHMRRSDRFRSLIVGHRAH